MENLTPDEFRTLRKKKEEKDYILIDVRSPVEYQQEHIPGSLLIPLDKLEDRIDSLPDKDLVFYCRSGARSQIAAVNAEFFISDSKTVYNLTGGILAWDGRSLSGIPDFKAIDMGQSPSVILISAINLEKGAWNFYSAVLEKFPGLGLSSVLENVRDGEMGHARLIYSHLKSMAPDTPFFDDLYEGLSGDIVEGGADLSTMIASLNGRSDKPGLDILETAATMEYQAYDLYRIIAETAADAQVQEAFQSLSQAEKLHMNILLGAIETVF